MIFGPTPLGRARGAVLAHTQRLGGRVLRKGTVLDEAAVALLGEHGLDEVIAATLEAGDVAEDEAASRLADALLTPLVGRTRAGTGRVNLQAEAPGLLRADATRIHRLNGIDESLTLATLPDATPVAAREMLATIKVIPFAVPGHVLAIAEQIARQGAALSLHPFRPLRVGLVMTELAGLKDSVLEGTAEATEARVAALTGSMMPPLRCAHAAAPIAAALRALLSGGAELLLVAGASAVVDRRDVVPAECAAALVCLGDMPLVTARMLDRLLEAYDPDEGRTIVVPTFRGKGGNPVLWDRRHFAAMMEVSGDTGARHLLAAHAEHVAEVEIGEDAVLRDFDTPETLTGM